MNQEIIEKIQAQILKHQQRLQDSYKYPLNSIEWHKEQSESWKELADLWMEIADFYLAVIRKIQDK